MSDFLRPLLERHPQTLLVNACTGSVVATAIEMAFDSATRRRGLLGRHDLPPGRGLVLAPCNAIHTCWMRFPIDVIFVTRDGRVTKTVERLAAWRVTGSFSAFATIELRAGSIAARELTVGDHLAFQPAKVPVA